jgi:FAD/FMN-containing dehydrogenase
MTDDHRRRVKVAQAEIKRFYEAKKGFRIYHGSTNSTRHQVFDRSSSIDMSGFNHILEIDSNAHTAVCEPNVPMDQLVNATLRHGLIPKVVMEFPGITVGGGIQGGAGESSSFRYGLFSDTCVAYEFITPDGNVQQISEDANPELFHATAGSYGTFGVIAAATVSLIPAKKYVHVTYIPISSYDEAISVTRESITKDYDYVDGIMFSPNSGVIIVGTLSDEKLANHATFSRHLDEWFYLHAEKFQGETYTESIPIVDYLFRYDRGAFWVGKYPFERAGIPFNALTRALVSPIITTRKLYEALQLSGADQQYVVQDLAIPEQHAVEFMSFVEATLEAFPLWICPLRPSAKSPLLLTNSSATSLINIGVWSNKAFRNYEDFIAINRAIEKKVSDLGGRKWFYAHSFYTEKEFWNNFDKDWYDALRKKSHADYLPDIYAKIKTGPYRPVNIKRAALRTIFRLARLKRS